MKTCAVGCPFGPLGRQSTMRGICRLSVIQSSAVGLGNPAACAIAGRCRIRLVEPPNAACTIMALRMEASVRMSRIRMPRCSIDSTARADRRAISSQMGCPDGASAACVSVNPSASATTCDVAAVPRNWQPPPGDAHARHRFSAASSSVISPCAKRAPTDCTRPASSPSSASSVTPPGTRMHGRSGVPASASIMAGSPLSQVATPITPLARGQRADLPAEDGGRVVAIGQGIVHARSALGPSVARVGAVGGERHGAHRRQLFRRRLHQQSDLPVTGVIAQRDRRTVGPADAAVGAQDEDFLAAHALQIPAHAGVHGPAEEVARGPLEQHFRGDGKGSGARRRFGADVEEGLVA